MAQNFLTVAEQVAVLFLLIGTGAVFGKAKLINDVSVRSLADIALYLATPCVIVRSFQREISAEIFEGLMIALLAAVGIHLLGILIAHLCLRNKEDNKRAVMRFAAVFSNAGYMALPLQQAILGDDAVLFGAAYVAVFNLFMWTYGVWVMGPKGQRLSLKKALINPGVIAVAVGLVVLLGGIKLPTIISAPIDHLANLNTPIPMLVIGYYLSQADVKAALRDRSVYLTMAMRLLLMPVLTFGIMYLLGVRGVVLVSSVVAASAPAATATTMFAAKYNRDPLSSVNVVVLSTLLSIVTMPLIVGAAKMFM